MKIGNGAIGFAGKNSRGAGWSRRRFVTATSASTLAVVGSTALTSCTAAAAPAVEDAAFNPAAYSWLKQIASTVGATVIEDALTKGLKDVEDFAFSGWNTKIKNTVSNSASTAPFTYIYNDYWAHRVPPVVLVGITQKVSDPLTDKMLACVNSGQDSVLFEAWAWQALSMLTNDLTANKTGADLTGFQALCLISLIPCGTAPKTGSSPEGLVGWMTYETRNGTVEISRHKEPDGTYRATIQADGIPDAAGNATVKDYPLPTAVATSDTSDS